jgi:VWFA-related protein
MFVVNFNEHATLQPLGGKQFTNDAMELDEAIANVTASGETALYDAIVEGFRHLELGTHDKKALIIVSDGGDDASQQKLSQVLKLAQQSHVVVYCIGLVGQTLEEENPGVLRRLSKDTGGIAYFPDSPESVIDISKQIAIDLREQYTLGYIPPKGNGDSAFRKVQVKVDAGGYGRLHARTKPGYFPAGEEHSAKDSGGKAP